MEEMVFLWSHQESNDELKLKIHYTALELEAVKAKATEEMNKNTETIKQLLQLLKLVCHERDEARDQIQKLLNMIMPYGKPNSCIAESNSHSDAYNHCSSPVNSLFDPVTSPELSNINTNTSFVQDHDKLHNGNFHTLHSLPELNHTDLMMESMIKGKALPKKGNLLKAVMEAGPLLQTLFTTDTLPSWKKLSQPRFGYDGQTQATIMTKHSQQFRSFSQMIGGGEGLLSFNDMNSGNYQGRMMAASCPTATNFGPVEKRQRFQ